MKDNFILVKVARKKLNYYGVYLLISKNLLNLNVNVNFIDSTDNIVELLTEKRFVLNLKNYIPIYLGKYELKPGQSIQKLDLPKKIYNNTVIPVLIYEKTIADLLPILQLPNIKKDRLAILVDSNCINTVDLKTLDISQYRIINNSDRGDFNDYILLDLPENLI